MIRKFNPQRLEIARKRRHLSMTALAHKAGMALSTVSRLESAQNKPGSYTIKRIGRALGFSSEFFYGEDMDKLRINSVSLNRSSSSDVQYRDAALAFASIAFLLDDWAHGLFGHMNTITFKVNFPYFKPGVDPESAARQLRAHWGLWGKPIPHMIELLESQGAKVFSLAHDIKNMGTFSGWRDEVPYIFCGNLGSAVKSRFTVVEQLGHLVLHRYTRPKHYKNVRHAAHKFASAFLMPEGGMKPYVKPRSLHLEETREFAQHWGVCGTELIARLKKLGKISNYKYDQIRLHINNSIRDGRGDLAPEGMLQETSPLWNEILKMLKNVEMPLQEIEEKIWLPVQEIEELLLVENLSTVRRFTV